MPTITRPMLADRSGPDLAGLDGATSYVLNADGETYTVTMPDGWTDPAAREVPVWRLRVVLDAQGLTPAIESALDAMAGPDGMIARAIWDRGTVVRRAAPLLAALAGALWLSEGDVDALFSAAEGLPA